LATTTVELRQMDVTRLDFPDRSFDEAVATFLFCTLPDELQVAGMRELGRVVKPGGIIRCLEYTRPSGGLRRAMTRLWEPWVYWAYGAGFDRQTEKHVPEAGLQLLERWPTGICATERLGVVTSQPVLGERKDDSPAV
jgi:ubiquinone/menaquinone biosynthesis C-methylase UbiE